jgi:hypothetical protein
MKWRMLKAAGLLLAASFISCLPAFSAVVFGQGDPLDAIPDGDVVDFEDVAPGPLDVLDLSDVSIDGNGLFHVESDFAGLFNTRGAYSLHSLGRPESASFLTVRFRAPVAQFALLLGASSDVWRISAYDAEDHLLETQDIQAIGSSNAGDYFGIAAPDISSFTLAALGAHYVMIDNLTFTQTEREESAPRTAGQEAIVRLEDLLPTGVKSADALLEKALAGLEACLDDRWWADDGDLSDGGKRVFKGLAGAVRGLSKALAMPDVPEQSGAELTDIIHDLTEIARQLAVKAVHEAGGFRLPSDRGDGSGAESRLRRALEQYQLGVEHEGELRYSEAVVQFGKAWESARKGGPGGGGATPRPRLADIPDSPKLEPADAQYLAVFEVSKDRLIGKDIRDPESGELGISCWQRVITIFPLDCREKIVQFNILDGRRWAGLFDGDGSNDVGRKGYRFSIAKYQAEEEKHVHNANRPVTPRRGTLDWTMIHELGHYICLRTNAIELFSQRFDGDDVPQPERREDPQDYPEDGSPCLDGNFVTSYAERTPGDEEAVETFTTYLLVADLPENDSLVASKIRFFEALPGFPELRMHVRSVGD